MEDITAKNEFALPDGLVIAKEILNFTAGGNFSRSTVIRAQTPESIALAILLVVIIVGSIFGNILVVAAVKSERNLQTTANFLICSLAITDFMVACLVMPFSALYEILGTWVFGDILCQFWTAIDIACCTASILHLCAIAFERHRSITGAVRYFSQGRRRTVYPKIILVWALAMCISIPPILGWKPSAQSHATNATESSSTKKCEVGHYREYTLFATLGSFYIPLALLLTAYVRIYVKIHQHIRRSESRTRLESLSSEDALSIRSKRSPPGRMISKRIAREVAQTNNRADFAHIEIEDTGPRHRNYAIENDYSVTNGRTENNSFPKVHQHALATDFHWDKVQNVCDHEKPIKNATTCNLYVHETRHRRISESILQIHNNRRLIKRFSESDVWLAKKMILTNETPFSRRRTQTTVGRVRFVDQGNIACYQSGSNAVNGGTVPLVKRTQDTLQYRRIPSFEAQQKSTSRIAGIFNCCHKYSDRKQQRRLVDQRRSSIMLAHSLSLRAKIKLLKTREVRAIKTLGTIVGAFVICWLPFFAVTLAAAFCDCEIPRSLRSIVLWLGYCNSLVNPILYGAFNRDFHSAFKKLLTSHFYKIRCR